MIRETNIPPKRWKGVKHCQRNATRHGAYSAQVYSAREFLRTLTMLLDRVDADLGAHAQLSKG